MTSIRVPSSPVAGLATAALAGLAAGVLTAYLQGVVSADWNTVANSGAVWTVVAFIATAALARTSAAAAVGGLLVLVGEVAGYYGYVADVRHLPVWHSAEVLWTVAALWIGPLTGLAAYRARSGDPAQRMTALAALAGVLAGEGAYLVRIAGVPMSGWVELALAAALATGATVTGSVSLRVRSAALAVGALVAAAVYVAYRLLAFG
jgi:hypothetical protein